MPTISHHGIQFDFADDGELLDMDVTDREEFMFHHEDQFDVCPSRAEIKEWARDRLADDAWGLTGAVGVDEYAARGVARSDFYYSTGGAR